ncbi:arylsulfatase [Chitinophaga sp. Mgbs1]|uniref:Arylsulfatase n=1 Tax=Chitinophaga solisilvae TaxID=1233460 RepID=A0A433WP37_9BACT|nr:arylsulfatase [Chitinophaga solisilvae]
MKTALLPAGILGWLLAALPLLCFSQSAVKKKTGKKPNIIYIYADDLGYGELGCYGQTKIRTPHLDQMAAEGVKFTQHYASTPVCAPSRCMLMTGRHGGHSYIRGNYEFGGFADSTEGGQMPLPENTLTIARMLKGAGYATGAVGKWGLGMPDNTGSPRLQGFDYFYGFLDQKQAHNFYPTHLWENEQWDTLRNPVINVHQRLRDDETGDAAYNKFKGKDYAMDKMGEKAAAFIKAHQHEPFFLYLPFTGPHVSLQAPDSAVKAYAGQFPEQPYRGEKGYASTLYPRSTYAAMITYLDSQVGKVLQLIKDLGLDDNTIIMFSSDNGATFPAGGADTEFFNSNGGLRGAKQDLYEGGIREPFIARWPGRIPAGSISDLISAQFDMMATFADISGIAAPPSDGISLLPAMKGNAAGQQQHPYLYFEFPEKGGQVAVRIGDWKGVKSNMKKNKNAIWELFNLREDVAETKNVAAAHPELVQQMEDILKKEHQTSHLLEWEFVNPKLIKNK